MHRLLCPEDHLVAVGGVEQPQGGPEATAERGGAWSWRTVALTQPAAEQKVSCVQCADLLPLERALGLDGRPQSRSSRPLGG